MRVETGSVRSMDSDTNLVMSEQAGVIRARNSVSIRTLYERVVHRSCSSPIIASRDGAYHAVDQGGSFLQTSQAGSSVSRSV